MSEQNIDLHTDTRDIVLSVAQINKIIAGLRALPAEPRSEEFYTDSPIELIEMFESAVAITDKPLLHSFVA